MATKSQDFIIDGLTFNVTQYNAREGIGIKIKLGKYLAPLTKALKNNAVKEGESILDANIDIADIISNLISNMDDDNVVNFIMRMIKHVRVDGQAMSDDLFDQTFAANYVTLYKLLFKIIEYNRFFGKGSITDMITKVQVLSPEK